MLCAALLFSYLESFLPFAAWLPLPGFKLGLPNLVVMFAALRFSLLDAVVISLSRVLLIAILFGHAGSFLFSLCGAVLSLFALLLLTHFKCRFVSCIGLSVTCAEFHNAGQLLAALLLFSVQAALMYAPLLIFIALVSGTVNGILLRILLKRLPDFSFFRKNKF